MKRLITFIFIIVLSFILFIGCNTSRKDLDAFKTESDNLRAQLEQEKISCSALTNKNNKLKSDYDKLQIGFDELKLDYEKLLAEYDNLRVNTADWLQLTDEQKSEQLAQAEADRIKAEEELRIVEEEKAAVEAKAQAEADKKAAEEAERRAAEEKKGYNTGISFDQLARNPDDYIGKKVEFTGEVLQVSEIGSEIQIRLATKENSWGGYTDNVVYIFFDNSLIKSRILDNDIITIYGIAEGLHSYTTVMGAEITLPLIQVDKVDMP